MDKYHQTNPPTELKSAVLGRQHSGKKASAASERSLSARDVEVLFCMALLRVLSTDQISEVLDAYNNDLKPFADDVLEYFKTENQNSEGAR